MKKYFIGIIFVLIIMIVSCGQSDDKSKFVGNWKCTEHYMDSMLNKTGIILKEDGTAILYPLNTKGTYKVSGNKVTIKNDLFGNVELDLYLIDGKLVIKNPEGKIEYEKQ
jgi:uncharacterized lipoprotein YehR (DUF1307 family)